MDKYIKFIEDNYENICKKIDENIELDKENAKQYFLNKIADMVNEKTAHYDFHESNVSWDSSGTINVNGIININQTIQQFLEEEFTGNSTASYLSGHGLFYDTYGDEFSKIASEYITNIVEKVVFYFSKNNFDVEISEELVSNSLLECYDTIYTNCNAFEILTYDSAIDFYQIGNIVIHDIKKYMK